MVVVNNPPVARNDAYTAAANRTLEVDGPAGVLANDSDADNHPLTANLVSGPSDGDVTLNDDGSFTYRPDPDFQGEDSFTYRANDGRENSGLATVFLTVEPVGNLTWLLFLLED